MYIYYTICTVYDILFALLKLEYAFPVCIIRTIVPTKWNWIPIFVFLLDRKIWIQMASVSDVDAVLMSEI